MPKTFATHAYEKMLDLYNNHDHEIGSQHPLRDSAKFKDLSRTDCITYVMNCLVYGYQATGNLNAVNAIKTNLKKNEGKGHALAKMLVKSYLWKSVYLNPDVNHPYDGDIEHPFSYKKLLKKCTYSQIPVHYQAINYMPTPKTSPNYKSFSGLGLSKKVTPLNTIDLNQLKKIKFGFGLSRGGKHTWLYSYGKVYEVHWDQIGKTLYEARPLRSPVKSPATRRAESHLWLDNIIIIPPSLTPQLQSMTKVKCR